MRKVKIIMFAIALVMTAMTTVHAQKLATDKVPASVTSTFKAKFPAVTKVQWELEDAKEYEANFKQNGEEASASFDLTGNWVETENEIEISGLPAAVKTTLNKEFAGYKLKEASKMDTAKNGKQYEAEIEKGEENWDVIFTPEGKVVSKTKINESEEKD